LSVDPWTPFAEKRKLSDPLEEPRLEDEADQYRRYTRAAERVLFGILALAALATVLLAVVIMVDIGGGRAHLADRLVIAVVAVVILGGLDTQATRLVNRRRPLLHPDPTWYRRFVVWSALGWLAISAFLLAIGLYLP
jgi:hypothetical protein